MTSATELWGTFAVDDHLRKRAYVAEAILFDRVVVPKPPEGDKEKWEDWTKAGWEPEQLKRTIEELGDLAIAVPWTQENEDRWRDSYESMIVAARARSRMRIGQDTAFDVRNIKQAPQDHPSRYVTRMVLADSINDAGDEALYRQIRASSIDPTAAIEAVVGYGSCSKFRDELSLQIDEKQQNVEDDGALLFGWDFFVPEDSDLTDIELLKRAVRLSRKDEFRASRREFHEWRHKLAARKVAPEVARAEMERCLAIYNGVVTKSKLRRRVLTALQVTAVVAPAGDFVVPGLGTGTGVVLGACAFAAERMVPDSKPGPREKVAALVHDTRQAFGWRSGMRD